MSPAATLRPTPGERTGRRLSLRGPGAAVAALLLTLGLAACSPAAAPTNRVELVVTEEGFEPAKFEVRGGVPVTLGFTRQTDATCATEVVIDGVEGQLELPLGQRVETVFTPPRSGELAFGCTMGKMIGGKIMIR
mgnify:CR=1 FL=1